MDEQRLYEPLPHGTIRLARLLRGQWNDPLKLDLFIANVSHHYVGLSYTWGSCKKDHEAIVNGIVKKIGLNLHCALRTLRLENESLILWVDAICINQDDKVEKGLQVNSMHQIFEKAQRVHAYVGTSLDFHRHQTQQLRALDNIEPFEFPEDDDAAWTVITSSLTEVELNDPTLLSPAQRCKCTLAILRALSSPGLGPKLRKLELFANQELKGRDDRLRELFEWLRNFVIAPWWARMWIIQEVGAARGLRLTYGKITMPFSMLESAAQELIARPWSSRKLGSANAKVLERFVAQVQTICSLRQLHTGDSARYLRNLDYYERSWGSPLLWLLRTFRHRHSSEPRDKIFALSNVLSHLSPGYYDLGIDYNAPISDLFCEVALSIIQQTGFFWITSRDIASKHRDNLPSWVPDWSWGYHNTESDIPLKIRLCHNASQVKFVILDSEDRDATAKYDVPLEFFSGLARSDPATWRRTKAYKHAPKTWTFQEGSPLRDVGKMEVTGIHLDWPTPEKESRYIWYEKYDPDSVAVTKVHHCLKIPSQFCSTVEFVSETLEANLSNLNSIVNSLKEARFKIFPDDWKCNFFEDRLYLIGRVICFGTVLEDDKPPRRLEEYDDPNLSLLVLLRNQKYDTQEPEEFDAEWKRIYRVKFMAETTGKCNRCSRTETAPCQECVDTVDQMEIPPPAEWRKDPALVALKKTAMKVAPGHCILFTRDGNLALGPPGVQTGDRISILMGGLCPHILRRRHERHYLSLGYLTCSLIGDCYLDKAPRWDPSRLETIALV